MNLDTLINLILAAVLLLSWYAAYCAGRNDGRREAKRQARPRTGGAIPMEHTHGGDADGTDDL